MQPINPAIIALTGPAGVGKSTVAAAFAVGPGRDLSPHLPWRILSFASPIKEMAAVIFGEEALANKDEPIGSLGVTPRHILQTLGTEWGRKLIHHNIWLTIMARRIADDPRPVVIDDCRFDNEAHLVRSLGGIVVRVVRHVPAIAGDHVSEAGVSLELVDALVRNIDPEQAAEDLALAYDEYRSY